MRLVKQLAAVIAAAGLLGAACCTSAAQARKPPRRAKVVWTTGTYRYGNTARQNLIAQYAKHAADRPWVLSIHGGSWVGQNATTMAPADALFNAHGYDTFAINYDLGRTRGVTEYTQLYEVRKAIAWVRLHAPAFGIDPLRGALYGYSAGGHLALIAGLTDPKIKAILATSAIAQPTRVADDARGARPNSEPANDFIGDSDTPGLYHNAIKMTGGCAWRSGKPISDLCATRWRDFSPQDQVRRTSAPVMLFAGTADAFYTVPQGAAFCYWMRHGKHHRPCTLVAKVGYPHGQNTLLDAPRPGLAFLAAHV